MHHAETERNHDGHLTFYLLLSGFRNNQNSCFNFLTSCPMYLFVPHPPTPPPPPPLPPPTNTQMDCIWDSGLGTIRRKRNSKRIHLMN